MINDRKDFSENERMVLHTEVNGFCPICGFSLSHKKNGKIFRSFEVAHIYPVNPTNEEIELLQNQERLGSNINDLENVLAVCRNCHGKFDKPRTITDYQRWVRIKKRLLEDNKFRTSYQLLNIEEEIIEVMDGLKSISANESTEQLKLNGLKIDEKVDDTMFDITKITIKKDVIEYFEFIKELFIEMDKDQSNTFLRIATQVKASYLEFTKITNDQEKIFSELVDWLLYRTGSDSRKASEIVISFFIQNCEVFG